MVCFIFNLITWIVVVICMILWITGGWLFKYETTFVDAMVARPLKKMAFKPITQYPLTGRQRGLLATLIADCDYGPSVKVKFDGYYLTVKKSDGEIEDIKFDTASDVNHIEKKDFDRLMVEQGQKRLANLKFLLDGLADGKETPVLSDPVTDKETP